MLPCGPTPSRTPSRSGTPQARPSSLPVPEALSHRPRTGRASRCSNRGCCTPPENLPRMVRRGSCPCVTKISGEPHLHVPRTQGSTGARIDCRSRESDGLTPCQASAYEDFYARPVLKGFHEGLEPAEKTTSS